MAAARRCCLPEISFNRKQSGFTISIRPTSQSSWCCGHFLDGPLHIVMPSGRNTVPHFPRLPISKIQKARPAPTTKPVQFGRVWADADEFREYNPELGAEERAVRGLQYGDAVHRGRSLPTEPKAAQTRSIRNWRRNLIPNAHMVAAGVLGVSRAQERGYTFSFLRGEARPHQLA